jgi:RHS repeat-associated protein
VATDTEFLYDPDHRLMTTVNSGYTLQDGNVYLGNRLLGDYTAGAANFYLRMTDQVGSLRGLWGYGGAGISSCISTLPFGDGLTCQNSGGDTDQPFTGKERDSESGLDYFGARYYGSSMGRFMSPDPLGGHLEDPQTLNRYQYVQNNPLTLTDPTRMYSFLACSDESQSCGTRIVGIGNEGAEMANVQLENVNGKNVPIQVGSDGNGGLADVRTGQAYTGSANGSGVFFSNDGGKTSSLGVFVNGTDHNTFSDAGFANGGALTGFKYTLTNSKLEANQTEAGTFTFAGSPEQAGQALLKAGFYSPLLGENAGQNEYRSPGSFWTGANSTHFNVDQINLAPRGSVPSAGGDFHTGEHNLKNPIAAGYHCFSDHASACSW